MASLCWHIAHREPLLVHTGSFLMPLPPDLVSALSVGRAAEQLVELWERLPQEIPW